MVLTIDEQSERMIKCAEIQCLYMLNEADKMDNESRNKAVVIHAYIHTYENVLGINIGLLLLVSIVLSVYLVK